MRSSTASSVSCRASKASFAWSLLNPPDNISIVDVGADMEHLKKFAQNKNINYISVGLECAHAVKMDLDDASLRLPFESLSIDYVVCLDVLEHVEHIYSLFSEICRISSSRVLIALPNPYRSFFNLLVSGNYSAEYGLKYYNLPYDKPPLDRHRWFYSPQEAKKFVNTQASLHGFTSKLIYEEGSSHFCAPSLKRRFLSLVDRYMLRGRIASLGVLTGRMWFQLDRIKF
jgi:hypothetical protein